MPGVAHCRSRFDIMAKEEPLSGRGEQLPHLILATRPTFTWATRKARWLPMTVLMAKQAFQGMKSFGMDATPSRNSGDPARLHIPKVTETGDSETHVHGIQSNSTRELLPVNREG